MPRLIARRVAPFLLTIVSCFFIPAFSIAGEWISLFDGQTLDGWQANEHPESWVIEDGILATRGETSHLFYVGEVANHDFKNFEFSAEVMTTTGSNSGIYFHTELRPEEQWPLKGYEAQVVNSSRPVFGTYMEHKMAGSIYAVRNTWRSPAKDNEWFHYRIKVSGRTIQTFINDELICEYTEPAQTWRASDKLERHLSSGTFALQCHDPDSIVFYRDLKVRLLPDDAPSLGEPIDDPELDTLINRFSNSNHALIDLGIVAETAHQRLAQAAVARFYGITLGYNLAESETELANLGSDAPVVLINDRDAPPSVALLKAAKANGARIAFSSGGVTRIDPRRLKARLQAMLDAELSWQDMWAPKK